MGRFKIKTSSYQYKASYYKDGMVVCLSYVYTGKMTSLFWIGPLILAPNDATPLVVTMISTNFWTFFLIYLSTNDVKYITPAQTIFAKMAEGVLWNTLTLGELRKQEKTMDLQLSWGYCV